VFPAHGSTTCERQREPWRVRSAEDGSDASTVDRQDCIASSDVDRDYHQDGEPAAIPGVHDRKTISAVIHPAPAAGCARALDRAVAVDRELLPTGPRRWALSCRLSPAVHVAPHGRPPAPAVT